MGKTVIVIYALDHKTISPWIYGVYSDIDEGYKVQEEMKNSEEYKHLMWGNKIVQLK